ncbi:MAG: hypothetical protein ACREVD_03280, partial [Burkholderiales bacterium]
MAVNHIRFSPRGGADSRRARPAGWAKKGYAAIETANRGFHFRSAASAVALQQVSFWPAARADFSKRNIRAHAVCAEASYAAAIRPILDLSAQTTTSPRHRSERSDPSWRREGMDNVSDVKRKRRDFLRKGVALAGGGALAAA